MILTNPPSIDVTWSSSQLQCAPWIKTTLLSVGVVVDTIVIVVLIFLMSTTVFNMNNNNNVELKNRAEYAINMH